ncbi:RelA/SpoT family protein [Halothiobacillus sp. DCM-1]|uniref:RelA/SpoT family protein n=1 Tax=Halothiobacillus sp. DCM-1 TaxID=3112558 RepID=UPI003249B68B
MKYALNAAQEDLCAELCEAWPDDARCALACAATADVWDGVSTVPRGVRVALKLQELGADADSLLTGLLLDPRLPPATAESLSRQLGERVAARFQQAGRLNSLLQSYRSGQNAQWLENLRRLLLSAVQDVRVILIQLVYRLEELRGVSQVPDHPQRSLLAAQTLDIYAPLAHRLGLGQIKWELEDLAFRFLEPHTYQRIARLIDERRAEREAWLAEVKAALSTALDRSGIAAIVYGRPKHIYSIFGKMQRKRLDFDRLFDVRALRIEVPSVEDCYAALSVVHSLYSPIEGEYDDYIARPKPNGYQSLHTAVRALDGKAVEVQIRTPAMHAQAELGVAAHWRYKEGGGAVDPFAEELNRLRLALAEGEPAYTQSREVFVFTPQGDLIALPAGSTVLDYAYRIHTLLGHRCRGAKINGQIVPIKTVLQQADRVEILTQPQAAPSREWAQAGAGYLTSASARGKVRNYFHQQEIRAAREIGQGIADRLFRRLAVSRVERAELMVALKVKSEEVLFEALGTHRLSTTAILQAVRQLRQPPVAPLPAPVLHGHGQAADLSFDGMPASPARCCHPRPGDTVLAFITRGQGLKLHRQSCPNIVRLAAEFPERILAVQWPSDGARWQDLLSLELLIDGMESFWSDLGAVLAPFKARVVESRSRLERNSGLTDLALTLELPAVIDSTPLIKRLQSLSSVASVQRRVGG